MGNTQSRVIVNSTPSRLWLDSRREYCILNAMTTYELVEQWRKFAAELRRQASEPDSSVEIMGWESLEEQAHILDLCAEQLAEIYYKEGNHA